MRPRNRMLILIASMIIPLWMSAQLTLDQCLDKATTNYPLIRRYQLVENTKALQLSDINKGWLPRISVYAQSTAQNEVPDFPDPLRNMISQNGQNFDGMGHLQYRLGAGISQTIWDGGAAKALRRIQHATADEAAASIAVGLYAVRERVIDLFFGILLMEEQISQNKNTIALLEADHRLVSSMHVNGTAMQSDADMIEAQILTMNQTLTDALSSLESYRDILGIFIGENLEDLSLVTPRADMPADLITQRPELRLFDARIRLNEARNAFSDASLRPKAGFFAQAFYGYPGFNNFESMATRDMSLNLLAGVKLSWNIDSFYTRSNARKMTAEAVAGVKNDREVFLFNNRMQAIAQAETINGLKKIIAEDSRIVALRGNVRRAAESQLKNGVIDATALLAKITDENQAQLTARYHRIRLLQNIYRLKNTLNK